MVSLYMLFYFLTLDYQDKRQAFVTLLISPRGVDLARKTTGLNRFKMND
jgi:hypothetical protein